MRIRRSLPSAALAVWLMAASPVAADCDLASFEEELATEPVPIGLIAVAAVLVAVAGISMLAFRRQ